ncbi:acyl-CoA synthetase [Prochlorococcus marinus]|uniref:acyl-CoA synthetase n=1 Tax=Prochlorococcus marinus TaxID=1219 RepID=UPI0001900652|nr:acyl-CoA synthetase [Prochlorococcus marinus]EEE40646.1 acetyl-coenzyme A synthetase 1 [Prochlorococcus marinus str. MIT 9202]
MKQINNKHRKNQSSNDLCDLDLYSRLLRKHNDDDIVASLVNPQNQITTLTKRKLSQEVPKLSSIIKKESKVINKQLKIFCVTKASYESLLIILSSAYLGAHHCICFEELSIESISLRIDIFQPDIIIYKKNQIEKIKESLKISSKKIILYELSIEKIKSIEEKSLNISPAKYKLNESLFTLFTSGSTGKPKAIIHNANKYIDYAEFTSDYFFGLNRDSNIFTATDAGWINGHTYAVYGPLCLGSSITIHEDLKSLSNPLHLLKCLSDLKVTCFYSSVTLLRLIKSNTSKDIYNQKGSFDISNLERIGSCGEPLADEIGRWAIKFFNPKKKIIVNTYFQTETGGVLVAPIIEDGIPNDYSTVGKPRSELGLCLAKEIYSKQKLIKYNIDPNEIILKNKWDGLFQDIISDRETNYWTIDKHYRLHDVGFFDNEGFLYIGGRTDDVINTAGHRISSSEIESICLKLKVIKEACSVAKFHSLLGQVPILFISLNDSDSNKEYLIQEVRNYITKYLSESHQPEEINIFQDIPKTRSGKIMRRMMRDLSNYYFLNQSKDYSTLSNYENFKKSEEVFFKNKCNSLLSKNNLFDLKNYCRNLGIEIGSRFSLSLLLISIIENNLKLGFTSKLISISSRIINKSNIEINNELNISKEYSFLEINNQINNSNLQKESCISDIKLMMIRFNYENNQDLFFILKKINDDEYNYNFDFFSNGNFPISKLTRILRTKNKYPSKSISKRQFNNTFLKSSNNENVKAKCFKCLATIENIANERGIDTDQVFLISVIDANNKKKYICDICFSGW